MLVLRFLHDAIMMQARIRTAVSSTQVILEIDGDFVTHSNWWTRRHFTIVNFQKHGFRRGINVVEKFKLDWIFHGNIHESLEESERPIYDNRGLNERSGKYSFESCFFHRYVWRSNHGPQFCTIVDPTSYRYSKRRRLPIPSIVQYSCNGHSS